MAGPLVAALLLAGCGVVTLGGGAAELEAVPVGPLGPVIEAPGGDGPPIECRGVTRDRCGEVGTLHDGMAGIDVRQVEKVIVSCIGRCTPESGEFRIDVVIGEFTQEIARGGYGSSQSQ